MTIYNKVIWSEGLFLRPQHFQQQDRHFEHYVGVRSAAFGPYGWGFTELELEHDWLATGKLAIRRARGVFPDGTPFSMPDDDPLPPPLEVSNSVRDATVYLAIPLRRVGAVEIERPELSEPTRLLRQEIELRDNVGLTDEPALIEVAGLKARLLLQSEPQDEYACVPMARIVECKADRQVALDPRFIPTVTRASAAPRLSSFLREVTGMLHQRGEALGGRVAASGRGAAAEIADYLMLQAINRTEPVAAHFAASATVHPEPFYCFAAALAGEFSTFNSLGKRPRPLEPYRHDNLQATFEPLIAAVRDVLSDVLAQSTVGIPIVEMKFGYRKAVVEDKTLFDSATFVLAARADVPDELFRRAFPAQTKVAPGERIADLVKKGLPGITIRALPGGAPRQLKYLAGYEYFELVPSGELWQQLRASAGIGLHVAGEFPHLVMELWAIRG